MKKATITDALDQATADMKKDTSILCSGYLNPNTMNQALEKAAQAFAVAEDAVKNEAQKKELKNDYGEEAHKKNLGSFVDLLECYDSVTHQRAQESKLTAKSKEAQEAEESEMEFQKHKTPIASTQRIILPNAHLNATKADQYKTFRLIDNAYVERSLYYSKQRDDKSKEHYSLLQSVRYLSKYFLVPSDPLWNKRSSLRPVALIKALTGPVCKSTAVALIASLGNLNPLDHY